MCSVDLAYTSSTRTAPTRAFFHKLARSNSTARRPPRTRRSERGGTSVIQLLVYMSTLEQDGCGEGGVRELLSTCVDRGERDCGPMKNMTFVCCMREPGELLAVCRLLAAELEAAAPANTLNNEKSTWAHWRVGGQLTAGSCGSQLPSAAVPLPGVPAPCGLGPCACPLVFSIM